MENNTKDLIQQYINQFTPIEKQAYEIAQSLGTSFNLEKSNGFIEWIKQIENK